MKKILLVLTLVAVLVVSLALGGCTSAYTKKQTDTAIQAAVDYVLDRMPDAATGPAGAAGPAGPAGPAGGTTTVEDLDFYDLTDDQIEDLRDVLGVEEWWDEDEDEDNGNNSTSGEVTVVIDSDYRTVQTSDSGPAISSMPVEVINGTSRYQLVTFGLQVTCDGSTPAELSEVPKFSVSESFGGTSCDMMGLPSAVGDYRYFSAYWDVACEEIFVAPNSTKTVFVHLDNFKTDGRQIWSFSVVGVWHIAYN